MLQADREHATEQVLDELALQRRRLHAHPGERFFSPALVHEVEALHQRLREAVDADDHDHVEELAHALRCRHDEIRLRFIERGVLAHLDDELGDEATNVHDTDGRSSEPPPDARRVLAQAHAVVEAARNGEASVVDASRAVSSAVALRRPPDTAGTATGDLVLAPPDLWAPGTFGPPDAPRPIRVVQRARTTLTVRWRGLPGIQDYNELLRRRAGDSTWVEVARFDHPIVGWFTHVDRGLEPDTRYFYRAVAGNTHAPSSTPIPEAACGHTRGDPDPSVWRVQLRLRIADVTSAGADGALQVRLQSPLPRFSPNGNSTWLDHAPRLRSAMPLVIEDDLERGTAFTYDLLNDHVSRLSDITMLTLRKTGADAVGIAEVALLVNDRLVFQRVFGDTTDTCLWLEDEPGSVSMHTFDYPELRAHPAWAAFAQATPVPPLTIPKDEMAARIEAIVGDALHAGDAQWRTSARSVELSRVDDTAMRCRLRLRRDVALGLGVDIDVRFDLRFVVTCTASTVTLTVRSQHHTASVDADLLVDVLTFGLINLAEGRIASAIGDGLQQIVEEIEVPNPGVCPSVRVTEAADLVFEV